MTAYDNEVRALSAEINQLWESRVRVSVEDLIRISIRVGKIINLTRDQSGYNAFDENTLYALHHIKVGIDE